jgi:hypothetical protein
MKNKILQWLLLAIVPLSVSAQCRQQDSLQLVALYNATNGANWINHKNWVTTKPIQEWEGISVNANGCVSSIEQKQ